MKNILSGLDNLKLKIGGKSNIFSENLKMRALNSFRISNFGFRIFPLLGLIFLSPPGWAGFFTLSQYHPHGPLPTRTQNPLYLLFITDTLEPTQTLYQGDFNFSVETSFSNLFEFHPQPVGIGVDLDMELVRTAFNVSYGLLPKMEIGMAIPFLSFSGGFLDTFIQGYHNAFGFPNAGRDLVNNGRFSYRVTQNGNTLYQVDQSGFGFGDLMVFNKFKFLKETKWIPGMAIKGSLKLPTGQRDEGTGSGNPDFGFSLLANKSYKRLHSYTQLGFFVLGGHADLDPVLRKAAFLFGQSVELNVTEHLSLACQITGNTSIFKNVAIQELSEPVFDLTVGLSGEVPLKKTFEKVFFDFGFTEDPISSGPSVDFSLFFRAGLEY